MDLNKDLIHDPKGLGQPPPYSHSDVPQATTIPHPVVQQSGQPIFVPVGQVMQVPMGQVMQAPMGQVMQVPMGQVMQAPMGQAIQMQPSGFFQPPPVVVPMVVGNQMGSQPASIACPSCKEPIVTRIEAKANNKTHMFACILCLFCLWPCAFIPYFVDSCRNLDHYCPNCSAYIGSYIN